MLSLPKILSEEKYRNTWEWDGWKPKAKPDAPDEVKEAVTKWLADAGKDDGFE